MQSCGIRDVYPESRIRIFPSRIQGKKTQDPGSRPATQRIHVPVFNLKKL
jgi:hypothetical protein